MSPAQRRVKIVKGIDFIPEDPPENGQSVYPTSLNGRTYRRPLAMSTPPVFFVRRHVPGCRRPTAGSSAFNLIQPHICDGNLDSALMVIFLELIRIKKVFP
jgi:hypothetical protein